jgi:hypothetical protein
MANWHFGLTRNWYLHFGPYVGFLLKADADGTDIKSTVKSTDFWLAFGIGVKIPISDNVKIFIEDDGQSGFVNIAKNNSGNSGGSTTLNSRGSLNVGINFMLQ